MSGHTPAQWHLLLSETDGGAFELRGGEDGRLVIAKRDIGTPDPHEGIANARLIAAAPELYEALREMRDAAAAMARVIAANDLTDDLASELAVAGVSKGFGKRAYDLLARIDGDQP